MVGSDNPSDVAEVNASLPRRYVDNTARPITAYQYRVIAYNSGPGEPSPYSNVTTGQGGKNDGSLGQRAASSGTPRCHRSPSSVKPITRPTRSITKFLFGCWNIFQRDKRSFVSPGGRVMFSSLYKLVR